MARDMPFKGSDVRGWSLILAAMMLLLLPLKWLAAAVLAAAFHEFCHFAMICLCRGNVTGLSVGARGAVIQVEELPPHKELLCALAGPAGGLCLLFFAKWIPRTAFCAVFQSAYNLLPLLPLDGGRVLKCILLLFLPGHKAEKICDVVGLCFRIIVLVISVWWAMIWKAGIFPLIFAAMLWLRTNYRKTLAN